MGRSAIHTQLKENTQGFNYRREREKWSLQIITEKFCSRRKQQAKPTFLRSFNERERNRRKKQMKFEATGLVRDERAMLGCGEDRVHE